jgi:potassium-transporting ATPase potassium-binding subunit
MGETGAGVAFVASLVLVLVLVHRPVGNLLHATATSERDLAPERLVYRLVGVDARAEQSWATYARSVLAFSAVSVLFLYAFLRLQGHLLLSLGFGAVEPSQAWDTAVSFVTNTNWQSYSGESTMGHLVQMAGLAVQNFVSAAVGIAVAFALVRGLARASSATLGNFWVDLVRISLRVLLPLAFVAAIVLVACGAVQNLSGGTDVATLAGGTQHLTGGPVASQEAIKELGTNGGGFYNANSAHPYENPTSFSNWFEVLLILVIPFSLPRVFGLMVGDVRQGRAVALTMGLLAVISVALTNAFLVHPSGTVPMAVGGALEGTEARFGVAQSATFAAVTTLTSTGAVNSFHDSFPAAGGGVVMLNMMLGEVAPGGVGSGLYGLLVLAIITVFVAGLMVGRTPEYVGKKIGGREIKFASLYFLVTPTLVLAGAAAAMALPSARESMLNGGPHGLSEVLYAYTSAANNNGSAFAGLSANTTWYNTTLGLAMLLGRFLPLVLVLGLAGSLAAQGRAPESAGTLPTHRGLFIGMLAAVTLVLVGLTYLPALALGPLAEALR